MRKPVEGGIFFGLLGPPIGSVPLACIAIYAILHSTAKDEISVLSVILAFIVYSYVAGGVPAFVTGVIAGLLPDSHGSKAYCLAVGLAAAVLVLFFDTAALLTLGFLHEVSYVRVLAFFIGPAFLSGTITAALFRRRQNSKST